MCKKLLFAYKEFWHKATNFNGKTSRSDWWRVQFINLIISFFTIPLFLRTFGFNIYGVVIILPQIAIDVRRLRDFGKNWKWIFVNLDPEAENLRDYLGVVADHMEQFQPENLRHVHSKTYSVDSNVKVLLDAFLEVYHVPSIHQKTVNRFIDIEGTTINLWPNGHSRMVTPHRRDDWKDPGAEGLKEIDTVTEIPKNHNASYSFYPNLVTPPSSTGIPFLTFWPTSDDTCEIDVHWFSPDWGEGDLPEIWKKRIKNFEDILFEDTQFAPEIQASVSSPGFKGVLLNYQERRIYRWQEELDKKIGHNKMEEDLSIPKVLGRFIEN